jgi:methyl-accepting chemotaxis protein
MGRMKIRTKYFLSITASQVLLFGLAFAFLIGRSGSALKSALLEAGRSKASKESALIAQRLNAAARTTRSLNSTARTLIAAGSLDRSFLPKLFEDVLRAEKDYFGVWAVFSPDGWDGRDGSFTRDPRFAPTGCYVPWAYHEGDGIAVQAGSAGNLSIDDYGSDYYKVPTETGRSLFLEPYADQTGDGTKVLLATYAEPVRDGKGRIRGSIGVDIELGFIAGLFVADAATDGSYARLLSPGMRIVADQREAALGGKALSELGGDEAWGKETIDGIASVSESGKATIVPSRDGGTGVIRILEPVRLEGDTKSWVYSLTVPEAVFFRDMRNVIIAMIAAFAVVIALMGAGVFLVTSRLTKPLSALSAAFARMEEGDLGVRVPDLKTRDEVSSLSLAFNLFVLRMDALVEGIRHSATAIDRSSSALAASIRRSGESAVDIKAEIRESLDDIGAQGSALAESKEGTASILKAIAELGESIRAQAASIAEAAASVEEMVGNVQSIAKGSETITTEIKGLDQSGTAGRERLAAVLEAISRVVERSSDLAEANSIIESVASRTNLLAMNAAIEAAHAGEAGKGFAVVADEIRVLAENSQEQSKAIKASVEAIRSSIDEVSASSARASEAFEDISGRIGRVAGLESETFDALKEQRTGGELVLKALCGMRDTTARVTSSSSDMAEAGKGVERAIAGLAEASARVAERAKEIAVRAERIEADGTEAIELSKGNEASVAALRDHVAHFKSGKG